MAHFKGMENDHNFITKLRTNFILHELIPSTFNLHVF